MPARHTSVFLHGGWRCGSTYVWNKFRLSDHTVCFYEPFHEVFSRCTPKKVRRDTSLSWNSRHPRLDRPYRDEYLPLLGIRGLRGYRDEFAVARYFPSAAGVVGVMPEVRYLSRLLDHAQGSGKRTVFGFSRSLARAAALKQALGGYHIVIRRNPVQQWLSCRSYRTEEGSVYFELCHFLILALAPADSPAGRFARRLDLPRLPPGGFQQQFDFLHAALQPLSDDLSYRAFLGATVLSQALARPAADLTLDIDRLSRALQYREAARSAIFERTGLSVSFDDCRLGAHDETRVGFDLAAAGSDVLRILRSCGIECFPDVLT